MSLISSSGRSRLARFFFDSMWSKSHFDKLFPSIFGIIVMLLATAIRFELSLTNGLYG